MNILEKQCKNVLTVGSFDLLHKGHLLHLMQIIEFYSKKYNIPIKNINLIVACITQDGLRKLKPKSMYFSTESSRKEELLSTGLVKKVVFQNIVTDIPKIVEDLIIDEGISIDAFVIGQDQTKERFKLVMSKLINMGIDCYRMDFRDKDFIYSPPSTTKIYQYISYYNDVEFCRKTLAKRSIMTIDNYLRFIDFMDLGILKRTCPDKILPKVHTKSQLFDLICGKDLQLSDIQQSKIRKYLQKGKNDEKYCFI